MGAKRVSLAVTAAMATGGFVLGVIPASAADAGSGLVVSPFSQSEVTGLNEGDIVQLPVVWGNPTGQTIQQTVIHLQLHGAATFLKDFHNCGYHQNDLEHSRVPESVTADCVIDKPIAPGEVQRLDLPIRLKATAAWNEDTLTVSLLGQPTQLTERGTGADVTASTVPGVKPGDFAAQADTAKLGFKLNTTTDLVAIGDSKSAPQGGTAQLGVGVRQNGSATVGDPVVDVVLPPGVKGVAAGAECDKAANVGEQEHYTCRSDGYELVGHDTQIFGITVQVEKYIANAKGSVTVPVPPGDSNPANNVADLVLNGSAVTPWPTGAPTTNPVTITLKDPFQAGTSASPSTSATTSASATTSTTSTAQPTKAGTELADTGGGSNAGPLALVGAGAVLAGAGVLVATRRRPGRHQV